MENYTGIEQMECMLDMAASMDLLSNELDKFSLHSSAESESAHSSSKYSDSAFDSHYSGDSCSSHSQTAGPVEAHHSITPHSHSINTGASQAHHLPGMDYSGPGLSTAYPRSSDAHYVIKNRSPQNPSKITGFYTEGKSIMSNFPMRIAHTKPKRREKSINTTRLYTTHEKDSHNLDQHKEPSSHHNSPKTDKSVRSSAIFEVSTSVVLPLQVEVLHMPSCNPVQVISPVEIEPDPAEAYSLPLLCKIPQLEGEEDKKGDRHLDSGSSGSSTPVLQSSSSSVDIGEFSSGNCTPTHTEGNNSLFKSDSFWIKKSNSTIVRKSHSFHINESHILTENEPPTIQRPLTPRVTVLNPPGRVRGKAKEYITHSPRQARIPQRGTVFYQDSLNPPKSPHLRALREKRSEESIKQQGKAFSTPLERKNIPRRNPSILQRLIRKRGSFKQESAEKKRLPVKRSLSNRITYHIRKGWIDYEEDLNFISQPSQPRAMGRMVDKITGKYHMVQLYRPPSGTYGIYISETPGRKGVFISRFANKLAAKFYSGLISPGDQIIRVNGKNVSEKNSVDDVYDLMTASDSVIFTVIPISMRSDWS